MQGISGLVAENAALMREVERLRGVLTRIVGLAGPGSPSTAGTTGRRGRRGRAARTTTAAATATATRARRTRRPITDPEALERRRAALAKARAVRAARIAERKSG